MPTSEVEKLIEEFDQRYHRYGDNGESSLWLRTRITALLEERDRDIFKKLDGLLTVEEMADFPSGPSYSQGVKDAKAAISLITTKTPEV